MLKYRLANKATIVARTRREIILDTFSSLFLERVLTMAISKFRSLRD